MPCFNLLGSGFAPKCKYLVRKVKKRAEVMKRKRLVVVGYLKQDTAHLLRDGHHSHALARVDALKCEIERAWCYDYIEQTCISLLQQLPSMQRQRDCPVECVEPAACVMFAAARFADLPELCDIRDLFIEKYGSYLEVQVNQKFVEKIASKPTTSDQKLEVLHNIAREFSLGWNGKQPIHTISDFLADQHENGSPLKQAYVDSKVDLKIEGREVAPSQSIKMPNVLARQGRKESYMGKTEHVNRKKDSSCDKFPDYEKRESYDSSLDRVTVYTKRQSDDISFNKIPDYKKRGSDDSSFNRITDHTKRESDDSSFNRITDYTKRESDDSSFNRITDYRKRRSDDSTYNKILDDTKRETVDTNLCKESEKNMRPGYDKLLPPPYLKPNKLKNALPITSTKASQQQGNLVTANIYSNHEKDPPMLSRGNLKQNVVQANPRAAMQGEEENHGRNDALVIRSQPDQKSVRKNARLSSIENHISIRDQMEIVDSCRRKDGRRRKENDTHRQDEDEEEAIMDKLLIHYSKKSRPSKNQKIQPDFRAPSSNEDGERKIPVRTLSLPSKPTTESQKKKIPIRVASFNPGSSNQRHVHPKLPDYDDLAARIAALRNE